MALKFWNTLKFSRRRLVAAHARGGLYGILGVSREASQQEIRSAYKKLVHHLHPDKHHNQQVDTTAAFVKCKLAYEILSDRQKRSEYDQQVQYQVVQAQDTPGYPAPQEDMHSHSVAKGWQDSCRAEDATASAAAVAAAAANSSGLSLDPLGPRNSRQQPLHAGALLPGVAGTAVRGSTAAHAAVLSALLMQQNAAVEQFSSMQEALEFLEQLDQQQALLGLAAEDYELAPGQQSFNAALHLPQGQQQRWGGWHPGAFVPNPVTKL